MTLKKMSCSTSLYNFYSGILPKQRGIRGRCYLAKPLSKHCEGFSFGHADAKPRK